MTITDREVIEELRNQRKLGLTGGRTIGDAGDAPEIDELDDEDDDGRHSPRAGGEGTDDDQEEGDRRP